MPRSTSTCRISDARTEAQIRVDRAAAIATTLTDRQAAAIEREAQAVKLQPYEAATRRAAAMREAIVELYPAAAQAIVDILRALAETEFEVAASYRSARRRYRSWRWPCAPSRVPSRRW
jgi:hypothetical protein